MIDGIYKFIGKRPPIKDIRGDKLYKVEQQGTETHNGKTNIVVIVTSHPIQCRFVYHGEKHFMQNWRLVYAR